MENNILEGHTDIEKGAYLRAIASIATADRHASPEEIQSISALCDSAGLSAQQKQAVINAANEESGEDLPQSLDILKNSQLKYSLITDLIAFAKSDNNYSEAEQQSIQKIAQYIQVAPQQFSVLNEVAEKAGTASTSTQGTTSPNALVSTGLADKLKNVGINSNGLLKGLLTFAAPMILGKMMSGGLNRGGNSGLGGMLGGMLSGGGGGLGSVISMLNGGKGMGSVGGLFSKIFGKGLQ